VNKKKLKTNKKAVLSQGDRTMPQ